MDSGNPIPDGTVSSQHSVMSDVAQVTAVMYQFRNLGIDDENALSESVRNPDLMEFTNRFKNLTFGGGSACHMDNNSTRTNAARSSHTHHKTKPVDKIMKTPITHSFQNLVQLLDWPSESTGESEDDLDEQDLHLDEYSGALTMRLASNKQSNRWMRLGKVNGARKKLSRGPIKTKIGGVSRHRHNRRRR